MEQTTETKRVLIGWTSINGALLLAGSNQGLITPDHQLQVQNAIAAVQTRPAYTNQTDVITDPTPELEGYISQFWQQADTIPYQQEGWTVKIADLKKVCTIQPVVECISSVERTQGINPGDLLRIAEISLPRFNPTNILVSFDHVKNAWVFSSPNPNLRIMQPFNNQQGIFGFVTGISSSFVQVVKCNGRYFMRDGHHRAYGFIANGISRIPVLYREFNSFAEMGLPPGLFTIETLMSERPPMTTDYFDNVVSGTAQFTRPTKVVVIQGLEISTMS